MSHLVEQLREAGARILIPTRVLAEFLTFADPEYLAVINSSAHFEVAVFDQRAAIESARAIKKAKSGPGKKLGLGAGWQKIKLDWQIAAIAKVGGADTLYTTDSDLGTIAAEFKIKTIHVADLDLPPSAAPLFDGIEAEDTEASSALVREDQNETDDSQDETHEGREEKAAATGAQAPEPPAEPLTSTGPPPPSSQSPDDAQPTASTPEPGPPSDPHDDPA